MKKGLTKVLSVALCLVLTALILPTAKVWAAPLYSGKWKDGNWSLQNVSVSGEGDEAVISGSGGMLTSVQNYNLGDSFTWSVDYSIADNYK